MSDPLDGLAPSRPGELNLRPVQFGGSKRLFFNGSPIF